MSHERYLLGFELFELYRLHTDKLKTFQIIFFCPKVKSLGGNFENELNHHIFYLLYNSSNFKPIVSIKQPMKKGKKKSKILLIRQIRNIMIQYHSTLVCDLSLKTSENVKHRSGYENNTWQGPQTTFLRICPRNWIVEMLISDKNRFMLPGSSSLTIFLCPYIIYWGAQWTNGWCFCPTARKSRFLQVLPLYSWIFSNSLPQFIHMLYRLID